MDWKNSLTACWNSVALQLPHLQESLSHLGQSLGLGSFGADAAGGAAGQEYELRGRRLRVVRQLGEGGYSFVYLVRQLAGEPGGASSAGSGGGGGGTRSGGGGGVLAPPPAGSRLYALKRVLCGSEGQLREAEHEVSVMRRLRHPCLLTLLDAATQRQRTPDGATRHVVLLLFPVYEEGNLFDFVQQLRQQRQQQHVAAAARREAAHRQLASLLQIFLQVCAALHAMHSLDPSLAHRDVKPQNVLLRRRQQQQAEGEAAAAGAGGAAGGGGRGGKGSSSRGGGVSAYDPMPPLAPPQEDQSPVRHAGHAAAEQGWAAGAWHRDVGACSGGGDGDATDGPADGPAGAAEIPVEPEGQRQRETEAQWWESRLPGWQREFEAVLMDFGSTREARVDVRSRGEAMAVQEDAERLCTAPYRAPELWDVASSCTIDERVDVWSLGCLLYFLVCGQSPFERAAGEAGGSLMLAVVNGRLGWPPEAASEVPESVRRLVERCLDTDPATRPRVAELAAAADRILAALLIR